MALHISGKLFILLLVVAALITAFCTPQGKGVELWLGITPEVEVLKEARADLPSYFDHGPAQRLSFKLKATGYNSLVDQTDSTPFITATGARTRFGIIAVSRDLLGAGLPYGSLVRIKDQGSYHSGRGAGKFQGILDEQDLFIVEDTMHPRKRGQVDVWFADKQVAMNWGVRHVQLEVVRYGRSGPEWSDEVLAQDDFEAIPTLIAQAR